MPGMSDPTTGSNEEERAPETPGGEARPEESGRPEVELVEATVVPEAATQHLAELSMEDPDALAALSGPESDESLAEVDDQFEGLSLASTQARGIPPRIGHGRWAPRAP